MTAPGESRCKGFSDRGSTPLSSTKKEATFVYQKLLLFLSIAEQWYIIIFVYLAFGELCKNAYHRRRCISSPKVYFAPQ